jgi:hypothetical protein
MEHIEILEARDWLVPSESMTKSYVHGWPVYRLPDEKVWRYADTGESVEEVPERPCPRCGKMSTPEGYDACIGYIKGAESVCCGHGVSTPILMWNVFAEERGEG